MIDDLFNFCKECSNRSDNENSDHVLTIEEMKLFSDMGLNDYENQPITDKKNRFELL